METNVYSRYFEAQANFSGVERRGAHVLLISDSEAGMISYRVAVSFFPHENALDFAISYDAYFEKEIFRAPGRRSKKRESAFLEALRPEIDAIAAGLGATVDWSHPLNEARLG
ncbi:MAG: hypothetical protein IJ654_08615 [Bacteroidales bacterium]|nr:hypothetical protein [Bacteroidales bacterium]